MSTSDDRQPAANPDHHGPGAPSPDPSATGDPDLEPGGSVRPGATPPESHSATMPSPHPPAKRPPKTKRTLVIIGCVLAVMVLAFVAYIVGLFG